MVTSYHLGDVPGCPNCGEKSRRVKGDYFFCPVCHSQWEEKDWDKRMAKEKADMYESKKMEGVISCINIQHDLLCDNCGKTMNIYEKYCVNHSETVAVINSSHLIEHSKRYCKKCSINAGYLKNVINTKTGEKTTVLFILRDEIEI